MGSCCGGSSQSNMANESNKPEKVFARLLSDKFSDDALVYVREDCHRDPSKSCLHAIRIRHVVDQFYGTDANPDTNICDYLHGLGPKYGTRGLLNDYVHLLHHHENDSDFDKVHDFFQESGADCQVLSCPNMERNNRNRATCTDIEVPLSKLYGASEPKEVNAQQIMDQMHCYWLHSYDLGYRLTANERRQIENGTDESEIDDDRTDIVYREEREEKMDRLESESTPLHLNQVDDTAEKDTAQKPSIIRSESVDINDTQVNRPQRPQRPQRNDNIVENHDFDDEVDFTVLRDRALLRRQRIIQDKKQKLRDAANGVNDRDGGLRRQQSVRLQLDHENNKFVLQDTGIRSTHSDSLTTYSFGVNFRYKAQYGRGTDEWFVKKKYDNLKEELLHRHLSKEEYEAQMSKAQLLHSADNCRALTKYLGDAITVDHVFVLTVYTDFDVLQRDFTMTFRKFENETKEEWKKRHSEFANWAQLLREAVDHHGSQMTGNEVLYHGINRQMFFASTIALFDGPLSTTKNENIAFGFANSGKGDEGLVIELSNPSGDPVRYFNCVWLSQYAWEDERFFLGAKLMIKNIKTATTGEDYIIYVEALNVIQHIFDGRQYTNSKPLDFERRRTKNRRQKSQNKVEQPEEEKMTDPDNSHQKSKRIHKMTRKTVIAMLKHELHRYAPDRYRKIGNMPKYIEDTLTFYCGEMTEVKLSWFALHGTGDGAYTFVTKLISDEECDLRWFKMDVLQMLFPNMKKLEVSNIYLCSQSLNAILGYCQRSRGNTEVKDQSARPVVGDEKDDEEMDEKSNCVLEEIVMYRPSKKDVIQLSVDRDGDNQMDTYDDRDLQELITKTVAEYQERFEACGWNMQQNHNIINIRRVS